MLGTIYRRLTRTRANIPIKTLVIAKFICYVLESWGGLEMKPKNRNKCVCVCVGGRAIKQPNRKKGGKIIKKLEHKKRWEKGEKKERKTNIKKAIKEEEPKIKLMQKNFNI
jgi:hypothetical protein